MLRPPNGMKKAPGSPGAFPFPPPVHTVRPSGPASRVCRLTPASGNHDPPELSPVGRDPVGQLHEIGDRELLGALRKKGMFGTAEIAEHRPQRVADHLAALAE